ncbi:MAG: sigma-54-dependent Fis family transcriptional regulator [Tissierellia bacterium]|nr:sigma-54-dependent Fis family transcriptional regulator [Tissierellia bacterium]
MDKVLIIDDEPGILTALKFALEDEYKVDITTNVEEGLEIIKDKDIDIVLLDIYLGDYNGLDVLGMIKMNYPSVIVISMTAYGTIESSVEAIQRGAYYYITKPIDINSLKILMKKALEYKNLSKEVENLKKEKASEEFDMKDIVFTSKAMKNVFDVISRIKDLDINVLISGESGTGKELIAKAIHYSSKRKNKPLISVNCAAIPYNLLESELFGYEKGAFTGANQRMKGKFELANGGTLLLDEIGDMEIGMQAKILRVLEERMITPLGSDTPIPLDVRILAATNLNLEEEVEKGNFREDLLFRLKVITIEVPPLRDRKEDIPGLTQYYLNKYSKEFNKEIRGVLPSAVEALEAYNYPGNVRELKNIIQRAVALANNDFIGLQDLPAELLSDLELKKSRDYIPVYIGEKLEDVEKKLILKTYEFFHGNKRKTAKTLGISERSLYNKLSKYGID